MPFLPVGGQAVIEGVMMRSPTRMAVAVRREDGTLAFMERPFESVTRRMRWLGVPVLRGAVSLFETLALGVSALNFSADQFESNRPAHARPSLGEQLLQYAVVAFSLVLGVALFDVAPATLTGWLGFHDRIGFGLVDGAFRLAAFVLYLLLISQWRDMARVLGYHGAEHKAIHALEAGAPLTPESVQGFSRFHPRCGTSFLFIVVVLSIIVFTFVGKPQHVGHYLLRVACMPLIAGVAFEAIRLSGRHFDRPLVRALVWPGMQFQRLTTREPDLAMCAVAIASLERVKDDPTLLALVRSGGTADVSFVH